MTEPQTDLVERLRQYVAFSYNEALIEEAAEALTTCRAACARLQEEKGLNPLDWCSCGHRREAHHAWGRCHSAACKCSWFVLGEEQKTAEAQVSTLTAALRRYEWQPIDTAPKDKNIVLRVGGIDLSFPQAIEIGRWTPGDANTRGVRARNMWRYRRSHSPTYDASHQPTHWMPLPDPPAVLRAASEGAPND
jgi:hypothetical protein